MFDAVVLRNNEGSTEFSAVVESLDETLPATDVTVRIVYSSLNYKDALALTNQAGIVRHWRLVPGIDLVGIVETAEYPGFRVGETVLLNDCGLAKIFGAAWRKERECKGNGLSRYQSICRRTSQCR